MTNKHNAKSLELDGIKFDSKAEAARYLMLKADPTITDLEVHPPFILVPNFEADGVKYRGISYEADFMYKQAGRVIVEDVKGQRLPDFKIKWKLFRLQFPHIEARLVNKKGEILPFYLPRKPRKIRAKTA